MKKLLGIILSVASLLSTQSFASSLNISKLKKITNETANAKEGTGTCIGKEK